MNPAPVWLVGAGGLLGTAVVAQAQQQGRAVYRSKVDWSTPDKALACLRLDAERLSSAGQAPLLAWCAGAGVTSSSAQIFENERRLFTAFLRTVQQLWNPQLLKQSAIFLASSAGAIYAGVEDAPYHENSPTCPLAAYGHAKLALEAALANFSTETGTRGLIGRISNLYGPGQNLNKKQGLISTLLYNGLSHQPSAIYVSMDTIRDYIYVDDAARIILNGLDRAVMQPPGNMTTKIVASGYGITIAALTSLTSQVLKRRPLIIQAASPLARVQARDLTMESQVWTDLNFPQVSLLEGMHHTYLDLARLSWTAVPASSPSR